MQHIQRRTRIDPLDIEAVRIVLDLPEEIDGDVDVRVDNGTIRNSRELDPPSRERSGRMKGPLGRGGTPIRLRASNGTISIR